MKQWHKVTYWASDNPDNKKTVIVSASNMGVVVRRSSWYIQKHLPDKLGIVITMTFEKMTSIPMVLDSTVPTKFEATNRASFLRSRAYHANTTDNPAGGFNVFRSIDRADTA